MSELVIDASIVMASLLDDEHQPLADKALRQVGETGGLAPWLWHLETRNALISAERRGRTSVVRVDELLNALKSLPIQTDESQNLEVVFDLARIHKLSFYDAIYLELAMRRKASLATLDSRLAKAAANEGLLLF